MGGGGKGCALYCEDGGWLHERFYLSLLDQCVAFYIGEKLTYDHVLEVLGAVDTETFSRLLRELLSMDVHKVIETVEELVMQGRELSQPGIGFYVVSAQPAPCRSSDNMEDVLDGPRKIWPS